MLIFILLVGKGIKMKRKVFLWDNFRGPDDNGLVVDGPGRLAKKAFENGALHVNEIIINLYVFI